MGLSLQWRGWRASAWRLDTNARGIAEVGNQPDSALGPNVAGTGTLHRYTSHICCGMVTPLPAADKMRRYSSMNFLLRREITAQQTADFRSALKAGGFPLLIPNCFLKTPQDLRNNAGPSSFASKAAKGVKPGAKISPRLKTSLLPS